MLGFPEVVIILVIVVLLFGHKRLPELGTSLGKTIRGFRKAMKDEEKEITPDESIGKEEKAKKDVKRIDGGDNPLLG